jgi:cytidylate kinase
VAVITIARQYGAGGRLVARMIAERLGYSLYDKHMLHEVAQQAGVGIEAVEDLDQSVGDKLMHLIEEIVSSTPLIRGAVGISTDFDEDKLRTFLIRIIREIAAKDNAVIIGRGGPLVLQNHPKTLRIYMVAAEKDRVENLMKDHGLERKKAEQVAIKEEKRRLSYLQNFDMGDPKDPALYHLVINTSLVDQLAAVDMICLLVGKLELANCPNE